MLLVEDMLLVLVLVVASGSAVVVVDPSGGANVDALLGAGALVAAACGTVVLNETLVEAESGGWLDPDP